MGEYEIVFEGSLNANKQEIITFIDGKLSRFYGLDDSRPDLGFTIENKSGRFGVPGNLVISQAKNELSSLKSGTIQTATYWEGITWKKVFLRADEIGEHYSLQDCGYIELFPSSDNEYLTSVKIVCNWNLWQGYWEWAARRLVEEFHYPIMLPLIGKVLINNSIKEFIPWLEDLVFINKEPPTRGIDLFIKEINNEVIFYWTDNPKSLSERIVISIEPSGNQTLLSINSLKEPWIRLGWWWLLFVHIVRDHYSVEIIQEWPQPKQAPLRKAGRKHFPEDIWAWKQINEKGLSRTEVETEWKKRLSRELVDPHRHFVKIIKLGWFKS